MTARFAAHVDVLDAGVQTTIQDVRGRRGYWSVGVPPSGAWDDLSSALGNLAVGNPPGVALLESVMRGPKLRFSAETVVCVTGAAKPAVDGHPIRCGTAVVVPADGVLAVGAPDGAGMRAYVAVRGGFAATVALGSPATFLLGGFGGHDGRALVRGDVLEIQPPLAGAEVRDVVQLLPVLERTWEVRVIAGPHGAPEHLTESGVAGLFSTEWTVDHRSDRTGVRLAGAAPGWARSDGGDAGLHPSNVHDSAYPVGAVMLSGDTPVIVGPDGPSLGGFVVPCVVIEADRWKFAQARPGDRVCLRPVPPERAAAANAERRSLLDIDVLPARTPPASASVAAGPGRPAPLAVLPDLVVRRSGDHHLLAEAGPPVLDLEVRLRIHLLAQEILGTPGVTEAVEGVRSLLLAVDDRVITLPALAALVAAAWERLPDPETVVLPVREVVLPIAFDDPSVHEAMARYQRSVRPDAPWCPDNVEFIRRVNGLSTREEVFEIVTRAEYLVVGLGDVYLGAPVAVPMNAGDRLVTTKYDPARTWTPENAVGIGGVYLCVYGMEGPGGYQLVGRTVPVWRYRPAEAEPPWLLRIFDRLRFRPVSSEELLDLRAGVRSGAVDLDIRPSSLTLDDLRGATPSTEAADFTSRRQAAFAAERARWASHA